ncbi:lig_chan-Glu_bd domain-containing protein [Nephila pilipes]|uniref:Lig_chan-Glu_bd domain-containing protein n=1 Tax=Nephila pilipes TaxID=299642 RepID=A0A8X6QM93_NEPPI|nr:lig_chan-Glu_bd domain-containing protein [Nephila pilipes]
MVFPTFLRIAIMPMHHSMEITTDEKNNISFTGGVEAKLIKILSSKLRFDYQLFIPDDKEWGKFVNDQWTGMVGMVHRNEADIALGDLTISEPRSKAVDFVPYAVETSTFVTKLPKVMLKSASFVMPFQWPVWLTSIFVLIFMPILFKYMMVKKISQKRMYMSMIGSIFNQPFSFNIESGLDRFLMGGWMTYAVLLSTSYTALLLSSLTVPLNENGIRTIKDLATAVSRGNYKCMTNKGSANIDMLNESVSEDLRLIKEYIIETDWFSTENAVIAPTDFEDNVAVLGPKWFFLLEYGESPYSNKYIFKEAVGTGNIGIAINKRFCCKSDLSVALSWIINTGIFRKFFDEEVYKARMNFDKKHYYIEVPSGPKPLSISDLLGPFILFGGGCMLSILIFSFGEIVFNFLQRVSKV